MKSGLSILCALLCSALSAAAQPAPRRIEPRAGQFVFGSSVAIAADPSLHPLADYAAEHLGCRVCHTRTGSGAVVLTVDARTDPSPEGYRLDIAPDRIAIEGSTYGGVFNGLQQLFRMLPPEVYARTGIAPGTAIACARIEDAPKYPYRGMLLDVARTWMGVPQVKRYIDLLAYHSINKLHLHLADDEGWRIEIRSHPELTEIGGFRGGDSPVQAVYGKWSEKYGGYFTQEEMRGLIRYAALRNIEIIPEIDLPGHSRNIASVHPEIRCNYPPDTASTLGYDYRSAWCVAREENYALLEDILGEICDLFPSEYIHIGGDEVELAQWKRCPDCRALMAQLGTTDPYRLEDLFMERVAVLLKRHGKRPAVWNEAVRTGTFTQECRVHGWESLRACLDATAQGYQTVVMPGQYCYFDMRQTPQEDGHDWAAIFDARKVYGLDLEAAGFSPEQLRYVVGLQGAFFSEAYVSHEPERPDYIDYMCFPRLCALSRIAWSGNAEGWEAYYRELTTRHYDRLAAMGVRFRLFPPQLTWKEGTATAATDDGTQIFYTVGNGAPQPYTGPLRGEPHRVRFFTQYKTGRSPYVADAAYYRTVAPVVSISTSMGESTKFPYSNAATYKGLARTRRACRQQDWILYTFAAPVRCREMYLQTGNRQLPKTIVTTGYAEVSYDGTHFERAGDLDKGSITLHPERPVRSVRIVSTCNGNGTPYVTIQPPQIKPQL